MKRQDISGQNTLHTDGSGGGAATDVNLTQIAGAAVSTGHGVADAGTLRVELPTDGTGQVKIAAGSAVIGHVITDTGSTTVITGNVTVVQPTGTNLHVVSDATSTTIATQATGTNLHTVVDSGAITVSGTVAATQSGTWTVQPGNTANTTAWKVDGSAVTQPVSGTVTANAGTNLNTSALSLDASTTAQKVAVTVTALQVTASGDTVLVSSGTRKLRRVEMSNSHATAAVTAGLKIPSVNGGATFSKKYLPAVGGQAVLMFAQNFIQVTSETISVNLSGVGQIECTAYYE